MPGSWITQAAAARRRGVTRQAIGYLTKLGRIRTMAVGGRVLVNAEDVDRYVPAKPGPKTAAEAPAERSVTEGWITQSEAARRRNVTPQSIGQLVRAGRLRTLEFDGVVFVNAEDLDRLKPRQAPSKRP